MILFGEILQLFGHNTWLANHLAVGGLKVENLVHLVESHDDLAIGSNGASAQTCTTTRRHEGERVFTGKAHDGLYMFNRRWKDNH